MRTWRWLGVNESRIPADINEHVKTQKILVEAGKEDEVVLTQREGGQYELQVHIEEGAKLHLVNAQLVPDDALYTCRVKVFVGKGATFAYTVVEAGARHTATELHVDLVGDDSKADIWGLYFGDGESVIDLNYVIRQGGRRTDANMQVRGALLGKSEKIFRGTLDFSRARRARSAARTKKSSCSPRTSATAACRSCSRMRTMWTATMPFPSARWMKTSSSTS